MTVSPATIEKGNNAAYQQKLLGLLGDRVPIAVMGETADVLAKIVERHPAKVLRTRPFPGKWTPNEIIGHLSDSEWVYGFRIRLILCEEKPTILGMDQELWVTGQKHNDREPADLLAMFRNLRANNLALWRKMGPTELARCGMHNERGPESLGLMLRMNAGHDLSHIDQITRYLAAIEKNR
ncbi:MAG: DinB family protein [Phycisphaerales bacterium]|nr:DinB family protein [Phycisphaerales bacterium]